MTPKSEILAGRMCRLLAGNGKTCALVGQMCRLLADSGKISHQRGVHFAAAFNSPLKFMELFYMNNKDAVRILKTSAKLFHEALENNNILFVFGNNRNPEFLEALFLRRHFLHMTGVKIHHYMTSGEFFNKCLSSRISESDFYLSSDGTTEMKLSVLPALMSIYKNAKMVGIYDESKSFLVTEKVIGNVSACIGFVKDNGYYVPNTVLKEDIRNISLMLARTTECSLFVPAVRQQKGRPRCAP